MNEKDIVQRAKKAESLINDPILKDAFENVRLLLIRQFEEAPLHDKEKINETRLMLELLKLVKGSLEVFINSGKMVEAKIERDKKRTFIR